MEYVDVAGLAAAVIILSSHLADPNLASAILCLHIFVCDRRLDGGIIVWFWRRDSNNLVQIINDNSSVIN